MKLISFQIKNCFGFRNSGVVELINANNLIYILGRNSSGKSSLLNAINYFEVGVTPSEKPNFHNFNKTSETSELIAVFSFKKSQLSFDEFLKKVEEILSANLITPNAIDYDSKLQKFLDTVKSQYSILIEEIRLEGEVRIHKLGNGSYHFIQEDFKKYESRKAEIEKAIKDAKTPSGNFNISGTERSIGITFKTFEDILFFQFPKIYIFNNEYSLNDSLPEIITKNWHKSDNEFERRFVEYLGKDRLNRYLISEDPEEREPLLNDLRSNLEKLINEVNENRSTKEKTDLLEMRLDPFGEGIQITVKTDEKKSYYTHLSDNTKFLFAYHLYAQTASINNNVLLFDEPNNGFHPTAQKKLLRFLQDLGKKGNLVIVSTHSEYLIDPDYLASVRLMSSDENKNTFVKNHFYNQTGKRGDFLALQPVFDAIGYKYGSQLEIENKVIIMEGVTDLLYLRAFNQILNLNFPLNIAPARGEGTIPHVISFIISQGLSFKVVIDTGHITEHLKTDFGMEEKHIHEIPIPAPFVGKMNGSGIEDLFSKKDFEILLNSIGQTVTATFTHVSNSHYMKSNDVNNTDKRLVAHNLYEKVDSFPKKNFEKETIENFKKVLEFCNNEDWFTV